MGTAPRIWIVLFDCAWLLCTTRRQEVWIWISCVCFFAPRDHSFALMFRWFGKNKSAESHKEKLYTIHNNTNNKITADPLQIRLEYIPMLSHNLTVPLAKRGKVCCDYSVLSNNAGWHCRRDCIHGCIWIGQRRSRPHFRYDTFEWSHVEFLGFQQAFGKDYTQAIPTAIKGAFTRQYDSLFLLDVLKSRYNSEHFQIKAGKKGAKNQDASLEPKPKAKKEPKVAKPLKTDAKPKKASPGKKWSSRPNLWLNLRCNSSIRNKTVDDS